MSRRLFLLPVVLLLAAAVPSQAAPQVTGLTVFPPEVQLDHAADTQTLVVQAEFSDGTTLDATETATMRISDKKIARLSNGRLAPLHDGKTELRVDYRKKSVRVPVTVKNFSRSPDVSFLLDVMPVFTKAGCNAGACHGSSRGKDGFHLSLFGYDPDGDYFRLTRENIGRRINLAVPAESLLLEKGAGKVQHTGGQRFAHGSPLHQVLLAWIQAGAPRDATNVARCVGIEIGPRQAVLEGTGNHQRLVVRARYSDGTDRDVTRLAAFMSNNETSAKVSDLGLVTAGERGEAFVMARFDTFTVGTQVISVPRDPSYRFPGVEGNNYIDTLVHAKLKRLRLVPAEVCDDATFLRRVHLDLIGLLPTPEETRAFVAHKDPDKRKAVVERLLQRGEFADVWVMRWSELLQIRTVNEFSYKNALYYYDWLRDQIATNAPMDRVVKELLTARGSTLQAAPANYFQVERDTLKTAENVAQVFMGMRIQCAQCHNHPFDRWTMNDYYSFSAFFSQVGRKPGEDPNELIIYDRGDGEVKHPVGGQAMIPRFLGGKTPELAGRPRRQVLAEWLASPENPYFARHLSNLIWAHFFGRGIIDPLDDSRVSNPPSNPELLDALTAKFTGYHYDFRQLIRDICASRTYQLSTRAPKNSPSDERNFSRASVRRIRAEVLLDCIDQVTEVADKYQGLPRGSRAVQIADANVNNYFLTTFGRATRTTVCSCEVRTEPNLSQALHLLNGTTTHNKVQASPVIARILSRNPDRNHAVTELYLSCLSRPPTPEEVKALEKFFASRATAEVLGDLFWSLLNSKEFIFNH